MKALYLSPNGYLGGAEQFVLDLCRAHLHSGFVKPTILFLNGGEAETEARRLGIQTVQLPFSVKLSNPFSLLKASFWIRSYLKEHQIEILHLTMPYAQIVSAFSVLFLNVKRIWFQHGPIGGWLDRVASLIPSDAILFNSEYLMQVHQKHCFRLQKRKYQKIHGLIPLPRNPVPVSFRNSPLNSPIQVACVGRITKWKGQDLFIRSLRQVLKNEKERVSLQAWIIGSAKRESDREFEASLQELIKELELGEVVELLGHLDRDALEEHLSQIDVLVHCSRSPEPFGMVIGEAMGRGILVIGSSEGGTKELLSSSEVGYTFDSTLEGAENELARLLERVLRDIQSQNSNEILSKKEKALQYIYQNHSPEVVEREIVTLYRSI